MHSQKNNLLYIHSVENCVAVKMTELHLTIQGNLRNIVLTGKKSVTYKNFLKKPRNKMKQYIHIVYYLRRHTNVDKIRKGASKGINIHFRGDK